MSPRQADPAVRGALIESAARLLAERQPLTLRRVAADAGTSTMAVYTHFGGMDELKREVRREGFERLASHMAAAGVTSDPVSDLAAFGWAYCINALRNPDLYRAMFMDAVVDTAEATSNVPTFLPVVAAVKRCIQAGRFTARKPWDAAIEMWAYTHGVVTLTLGGMLSVDDLRRHLHGGTHAYLVGNGDGPAAAERSLLRAKLRMEPPDGWPGLQPRRRTLAVAADEAERPHPR